MDRLQFALPLSFDPKAYIQQPLAITRLITILFSIVIMGTIHTSCYTEEFCLYNKNVNACNYGSVIAVLFFIASIIFICIDVKFDDLTNKQHFTIIDVASFGFLSFLTFVGFCFLTNQWNNTDSIWIKDESVSGNGPRTVIAFYFFSIFSLAGVCYFALMRHRSSDKFFNDNTGVVNPENYVDPAGAPYPGFTRGDVDQIGGYVDPNEGLPKDDK